jgi:biotin-(acetyl-CoA carboxylase) ligase
VDSTNNYVMHWHEGLPAWKSVGHHQTKEKVRGKVWETMQVRTPASIIIQPSFLLTTQGFQLLATTAVAVRNQLEKPVGDEAKIKWPNDLYYVTERQEAS